jgi:hypothetical protein
LASELALELELVSVSALVLEWALVSVSALDPASVLDRVSGRASGSDQATDLVSASAWGSQ